MKKNNKKGFTIVELVIVIAVIAILAAVLIPTFSSVIKKAKVNNDIQLVRNLNTALATDTEEHKTMQDALDAAAKFGYDVAKINASATDNEILWDSKNDVFCYLNTEKNALEYIPSSVADDAKLSVNSYLLWKISKTVDPTYSTYYTGDATTFIGENAITKGFDAGTTKGITAIEYKNTTATPQEVVIRTNSKATTLKVTDTNEGSHIKQYGVSGIVEATVAMNSMEINGEVGYLEIKTQGHIVVNGSVELVYTEITNPENVLVEGKVEHAHVTSEAIATSFNAKENSIVWDYDGDTSDNHPTGWTLAKGKYDAAPEAVVEQLKQENSYVCHINGTGYDTVGNAFKNVKTGETIVLLSNATVDALTPAKGIVTLDLSEYTLSKTTTQVISHWKEGTLIIKGSEKSKIEGDVRCGASSSNIIFSEDFYGKMDGTLVKENGGNFTIKNGYFKVEYIDYLADKSLYYVEESGFYKVATVTADTALASATISGNTKYFKTLDDAFVAAKAGGTVTLLKNFNGALSNNEVTNYSPTGDVIFDLNGYTWDLKDGSTSYETGIRLYSGNLTVKNGTIVPSSNSCRIFEIEGGTLTIESGTYYDASRGDATSISGSSGNYCKGLITIKGGIFGKINTEENMTISGGTFNGIISTRNYSDKVVNITGGTFNKTINIYGTWNISGGVFNCVLDAYGTANISGGEFNISDDANLYGTILYKRDTGVFNITGCKFSVDPTAYFSAETHTVINNEDGTWTVSAK